MIQLSARILFFPRLRKALDLFCVVVVIVVLNLPATFYTFPSLNDPFNFILMLKVTFPVEKGPVLITLANSLSKIKVK